MSRIYVIGSLRQPTPAATAARLRAVGHYVFDDWLAAGPEADDKWREYEMARGRSYIEALQGHAATHVFNHDKKHLDDAEIAVLALPAGKSGHLELGYMIGQGKKAYILLDGEYDRWDVMYRFATGVCANIDELIEAIGVAT